MRVKAGSERGRGQKGGAGGQGRGGGKMTKTRKYAKKKVKVEGREPKAAEAAAADPRLAVDVSCASCEEKGKPNQASVFCIQDCEELPVCPARPLPPPRAPARMSLQA